MSDHEHTPPTADDDDETTDVRDELVQEPTEHLNRPDQPDFDPAERDQFVPEAVPSVDDDSAASDDSE